MAKLPASCSDFWDAAIFDFTLTEEEISRLEQPYVPHPVLGHSYGG